MVLRLCAPIEGTDAARLADCLGLDPAKYHAAAVGASVREAQEEALVASASALDDDARYKVRMQQLPVPRVTRAPWTVKATALCIINVQHTAGCMSACTRPHDCCIGSGMRA